MKHILNTAILIIFCFTFQGCEKYIRIGSGTSDRNLLRENQTSLQKEKERNIQLQREIDDLNNKIARLERDINLLRKKRFSILFTGDILIANGVIDEMQNKGINYPFKNIADELRGYDIVFGNLETPITSEGTPYTDKAYTFSLDPQLAACLRWIKLDIVSISNNHIMDYGDTGMHDTISKLDDMNILHTGAGNNLDEARKPVFFQMADTEVVVLAYCARPPEDFYADEKKAGVAPLKLDSVIEDIKRYKGDDTVIIVSLHWGIEQTSAPQSYQRRTAYSIIKAGADAIIGHHPHWPQGIEMYRNRPIIYSLGNFINGFYNEVEKDNIFAALHFNRKELSRVELIPVAGRNSEIHFQPYVMKEKEAVKHLNYIRKLSRPFRTNIQIRGGRGYINMY